MVRTFPLILFLVAFSTAALVANAAASSEPKGLSDEDTLNLQAQRAIQRDKFLQRHLALSAADQAQNKMKSDSIYATALKSYEKGDFIVAKKLFESAIILQPDNDQLFFDYGKCLYRQGTYKLAMSVFLVLENASAYSQQSDYYEGLSHYKLKNFDSALRKFKVIQDDQNSELSPSAAFVSGQIYYQQANYNAAKKSFQFVLDRSKDPKMDNAADKYLDFITQQENAASKLGRRFGYTLNVGVVYDGNVLNVAEDNSATSLKAYRLSYGGTFYYNVVNKADQRWAPTFTFYDLYSVNTNFKSDTTIQGTDPLIVEFSIPYTLNSTWGKKPTLLQVTPTIQQIYMTKEKTTRELIFNNVLLSSSLTLGYSNYFTMVYKLDLAREQSYIQEVSPDDEQTAQKYGLTISNYYLIDRSLNENITLDLAYLVTDAEGINAKYKKTCLSLGYIRSLGGNWSGFTKADYYNSNYNQSTIGRKDTSLAAAVGGSYNIRSNEAISFSLQYQTVQSTVDSYKYNKILFTTQYSISRF